MPLYAHVAAQTRCPFCQREDGFAGLIAFGWGYCPGRHYVADLVYRVGDPILWRACPDGTIPAWTFFGPSAVNSGDPAYTDLIACDPELMGSRCTCGQRVGGGAVEIRGGVITRAWIYPPGELDKHADIYLIAEDGELISMWDWDDHPVSDAPPECVEGVDARKLLRPGPPQIASGARP
ncbi:MAG: hypothetical protein ACREJP_02285 [Candidatus Methylomirabilales bacterium]